MIDLLWPKTDSEQAFRFDQFFFQKQAHRNYKNTIKQFKKIAFSFTLFNASFFLLFFIELVLFSFFFAYLSKSSVLAVILGSIFLSCFTYFVLLFYFQAKKTEQIVQLKDRFIDSCRRAVSVPVGSVEHHLTIAHAAIRLGDILKDFEYKFYTFPKKLNFLNKISQKLSCFLYKEDVFKFKEQLISAAILEHIKQIHITPTDLEVHASIANAYSNLAKLYMDAQKQSYVSKNLKLLLDQKFNAAVKNTIEEFKILNDYAPNDPWVHAQLAQSYHILNMQTDEAQELEKILKICPYDNKILFRLGVLYFEMNQNSKALNIYEKLKNADQKNATELLTHYGIARSQELFEDPI